MGYYHSFPLPFISFSSLSPCPTHSPLLQQLLFSLFLILFVLLRLLSRKTYMCLTSLQCQGMADFRGEVNEISMWIVCSWGKMNFQEGPPDVWPVYILHNCALYTLSLGAHDCRLTFPLKTYMFIHHTHSLIKVTFLRRWTVQKLFCHESVIALKMPLGRVEESISNQIME